MCSRQSDALATASQRFVNITSPTSDDIDSKPGDVKDLVKLSFTFTGIYTGNVRVKAIPPQQQRIRVSAWELSLPPTYQIALLT